MEKLKCYVVGAGFMGTTHLDYYVTNPFVNVLGIVDSDQGRGKAVAAKYKIKWYPDLDTAFTCDRADFCDICLPSAFHCQAVVKALENGADVVCEKPMAVSLDDVRAIKEAEKNSSGRLMIAHVCRFMPQYYVTKQLLDSGTLGAPVSFVISRESETPAWSYHDWLFDRKLSGGTLMDLSIHDLDISNWFFGIPSYHALELCGNNEKKGADFTLSVLGYPNGVQSTVIANHLLQDGHPFATSFRLTCMDATVEYNTVYAKDAIRIYRKGSDELIDISGKPGFSDGYAHELEVFVNCIKDGADFPISVDEAGLAVETVHRLYDNMHTNMV